MSSELAIRWAIVRALKARGAWVVVTTGISLAGCPDLLVCIPGPTGEPGRFMALEVKVPGRYPTKRQRLEMKRIKHAGGIVDVVRSVDEALALLGEPSR